MSRTAVFFLVMAILVVIDIYAYFGLRSATEHSALIWQRTFRALHWALTTILISSLLLVVFFRQSGGIPFFFTVLTTIGLGGMIGKVFYTLFLLVDDARRLIVLLARQGQSVAESAGAEAITRSEFLTQAGAATVAVPLIAMSYGIAGGAHDYRVRKRDLWIDDLPPAFDGIKIVQISDIHTGSFWSRKAVKAGMDLLMDQKPDVVFFTGDIVNNVADELKGWTDIFDKIKAPLGVYSTLGNHDYGDYVQWDSPQAKTQNLNNVVRAHRELGWDLLLNENRKLKVDGDELTILGVENWSDKGRFPKYGRLDQALSGTDEGAVKLLLSHDPSHWRAQILDKHPDIRAMFAGHTHGMQFGVEIAGFRWSPVKYMYPEWADLYTENNQHLYVNRGFGYIGYPGRIGILPEISLFTLRRGSPIKS